MYVVVVRGNNYTSPPLPPPPPLTVVTVSLEESELSVNESERMFSTCVVKDRDTVIPLQVEIRDSPLTATRGAGKPLWVMPDCVGVLIIMDFNEVCQLFDV